MPICNSTIWGTGGFWGVQKGTGRYWGILAGFGGGVIGDTWAQWGTVGHCFGYCCLLGYFWVLGGGRGPGGVLGIQNVFMAKVLWQM